MPAAAWELVDYGCADSSLTAKMAVFRMLLTVCAASVGEAARGGDGRALGFGHSAEVTAFAWVGV